MGGIYKVGLGMRSGIIMYKPSLINTSSGIPTMIRRLHRHRKYGNNKSLFSKMRKID
jgi:hypothetical protein